ncbi:MAG TPA: hypothetical protein VHZ55_21520 [Bryobacteraceae bacterium]|nr:hypothetical protein [Bryobacteraceae bacterium]
MKFADAVRVAKTVKVEHARKFAAHVVPEVVRPARIIWNQAIGGVFLLFALLFFGYAVKYFRALHSDTANPVALAFSVFMGAVMAFFGIGSFRKANSIGRR